MAPVAEGFGSHNKTSFLCDHSSNSNCLFYLIFSPPVLSVLWPLTPVSEAWQRFSVNFFPTVSFFQKPLRCPACLGCILTLFPKRRSPTAGSCWCVMLPSANSGRQMCPAACSCLLWDGYLSYPISEPWNWEPNATAYLSVRLLGAVLLILCC